MHTRLLHGNQEISIVVPVSRGGRSSGRPGAVADEECDGEVGLVQSSEEAREQNGISCCGACGTNGRGQGECAPADHGPDAKPGSWTVLKTWSIGRFLIPSGLDGFGAKACGDSQGFSISMIG